MKDITVLTACKNREKNLNMSRKNIVNLNHIIEHLIIDWSSNKTIQLENTKNSRVIVKDNEKYYWASRAYNFGVNFVQTDYVLKLDTDTLIDSDKFNKLNYHKYDLIIFYKEKHDPGNFLVNKEFFLKVNGLNEYIYGWGWEDHDLINRLKIIIEPTRVLEVTGYIDKIAHKDSKSVAINDSKSKLLENRLYSYGIKKAFNQTNSYLSSLNLWKNQVLQYNSSEFEINHFYSVEQLHFLIRLKHRFYFFKTLFMILYPKKRFYRRLAPLYFSFYNNDLIMSKFGIEIYPSN